MANNKVQLSDGTILLDVSSDSVTPDKMLSGTTAHNAAGEPITGTLADRSDAVLYTPQTLTDEQKKQARDNIDAASEFVITGTPDSSGQMVTLDKTAAQIRDAISMGKTPVVRVGGIYFPLLLAADTDFIFGVTAPGGSSGVMLSALSVGVNGAESISAKVLATDANGVLPQQTMAYGPRDDMEIATKGYVDDHVGTRVALSGTVEGEVKGYTSTTYQQIKDEIAKSGNIWLTINGETIRLASWKQSGSAAYTLIFFGASHGSITTKYEVTASASSASLTVTG